MEQVDLILFDGRRRAVGALGLGLLVQAHTEEHDICLFRQVERGRCLARVVTAVTLEARLVAHAGKPAACDRAQQGVQLSRVHEGGARALIARRVRKVTDQGDAGTCSQRQRRRTVYLLILKQHDRGCSRCSRHIVV